MLPYDEYLKELRKFPTCFRAGVDFFVSESRTLVLLEQKSNDEFYGNGWATPGGTILMEDTLSIFWERHSRIMQYIVEQNPPEWIFCGVIETPYTKRHHGFVELYGRIWNLKPETRKGEWCTFEDLTTLNLIPSCRKSVELIGSVLFENAVPTHYEFLGTDESE